MENAKKLSLTFRVDNGVIEHNNRTFKAKNVDADRTSDNIIYKSENLREKYHELFDAALEEYNSRKRSNEKILDYYEHIKNGKQEKPFYEAVIQFGDTESCGLKSGNWEIAKEMLDEYMLSFEERNKNIKVFNAVLHLDEATPHFHIDFVPICTNQTRGLSTRVSLKRALAEQGIVASSHKKSEWRFGRTLSLSR
ncbi:MAG: plasmid recombination protein [Lachnospiraceae bacterium]|nr:plasmid recombination protein [Ruminococcus sp.]MCM1276491.1 plasmid recombination protein [Lachnospiraceae bacterium]